MKRILVVAISCLLFAMPLLAYADALVEPQNDFYWRYWNQTVYLGRSFVANGENGTVPVREEPGASGTTAMLQKSDVTYVERSCLYDREFWGYTDEYSGWVPLGQMLVLYDYVAFAEEHPGEFYLYDGDFAEIKNGKAAIAWPWPGAEDSLWTYEDLDTEYFFISYAYMDDNGNEWGFITYLYGGRNIWVCLSDPLNPDLPALHPALEPSVWVLETAHIDIYRDLGTRAKMQTTFIISITSVLVLIAGTAVLIKVLWKPKELLQEDNSND
ncbi:MAG: hypothetical protein FWF10_06835 [Clostridiales bacterium]|nr:hypothetical protein [Clostridiales bacterium]